MKIIDLFSGTGGFSLGFKRAGYEFTEHYFSEIDKHAIANYKHNFPNAKYIGDITTIHGRDLKGIDIITFGSPCQDFSLAGKRQGLAGDRSSLIKEAIRLIADIRPSVFVWENVKGAFSSNSGEDFTAILQAFANIGGYRLEWQLLNTSWVLPQNRERIYLVGHLAERSECGVFPIGEDDFTSRKEKKHQIQTQISGTLKANGNMNAEDTYIQVGTYRTHNDGKGFRGIKENVSPTIPARARTDGSGQPVIRYSYRDNNIRRLTEIECERLQGFPDDWTKWGCYDGETKEIAKTNRYKLIGNAVTVDIVELIARRIKIKK
jgi:DNA (cytosine-5-)-methyltransferase|nr:MAG TPA: Cytosine specific methyltransferase [Caudoviricetes sp.]